MISLYCRYINGLNQTKKREPNARHLLVTSLHGNNPRYTYGAVRNMQLHQYLLSDWTVRIYMYRSRNSATAHLAVPELVVNKLRLLGAQIVYVNDSYVDVDPTLWKYDVINDQSVDRFIMFDVDSRLDEGLETVVKRWLSTNDSKNILCIYNSSDAHKNTANSSKLLPLFGANRKVLQLTIGDVNISSINTQAWRTTSDAVQNVTASLTTVQSQSVPNVTGGQVTENVYFHQYILPLTTQHGQCLLNDPRTHRMTLTHLE